MNPPDVRTWTPRELHELCTQWADEQRRIREAVDEDDD